LGAKKINERRLLKKSFDVGETAEHVSRRIEKINGDIRNYEKK